MTHVHLPRNLSDVMALDELVSLLTSTTDLAGPNPYDYGFSPSNVAEWLVDLRHHLAEHSITLQEALRMPASKVRTKEQIMREHLDEAIRQKLREAGHTGGITTVRDDGLPD